MTPTPNHRWNPDEEREELWELAEQQYWDEMYAQEMAKIEKKDKDKQ